MDGRGRRGRPRQQPPGGGPGRAHRDKTTHQQPDPNGANQGADPPRQRGAFQPRGSLGAHGLWPLRCEPRQERRVGSGRVLLQEGRQSNGSRAAQDGPRRQREEPATKATGNESPLGTAGNERQRPPGPRDRRRCSSLPPAHQPRRIGFMFLEELLQKDPSEVAITLASSAGLEEALSQTAMRPGFLQLLCQVLRKACCSRLDRQSIQQLLGTVKESNFLKICLPQYVSGMLTEAVPAVRQQCPEHISNIVALVQELVSVFPASSIQKVAVLMPLLPMAVNALRASGVDFTEEGERHLEKVQGLIQHLQEKKREGTLRLDSCTRLEPLAPGQGGEEEYRAMSVYPTYEEVHSGEKAFLRPNILSRPFESPSVYLDTHFRLLREDFVRPLREGIVQLLHCFEDKGLRKKRFDDIRVYFDARIQAPLCAGNGIDHKVTFDTKALKSVRWENSKRLLYGSLVCLSKDNFETFLFATVSHRDSQDLQQGVVHLSFCEPSRPLLAEVRPSDTFLMVETTAYFEAYRHVLQGLQEIEEEDVPFQKYIVRCESQVGAPAYLEGEGGSSTYDLRCLVKEPAAAQGQEGPEDLGGLGGCWTDILKPHQWPAKDALGLDESQLQALQLALTKELAIIQGPPGTGKTYVGLKIVEALLRNQAVRGESPILVVCYTNHALDQFLEGIHVFQEKGIVRVGGRSSSESLKQFTLRELRSKGEFWKGLPSHLRLGYNDISSQMQEAKFELDKGVALLECGQQGVLHECHLRSYISSQHWDSLAQGQDMIWMDRQNSFILNWLGLSTRPFYRHVGDGQAGADNAGAPEEEEEEEEERQEGEEELLLAITEEADLIQAERLLDQDEVGRPRPQKWKPRKDVVQLDDLFLAMKLEEEEEEDPLHKEEDWEVQPKQKKKMKKRARTELRKAHGMTEAEAAAVQDVWGLTLGARWRLYRHWVQKYQAKIWRSVLRHEETYQGAAERLAELRLQEDLCILQKARVVGMTTTGAARYRQVLQQVAPRVVIVEEAAEVLEAHTITTLSRACQHLILIGDHQQLRPSANVYDLAKNFNLEVSLFERLVKVGLPFVRLNFQHRMRPEIARLLTPHIYQDLENHPSVLQYENIKGISSNLFFVEHNIPEQEIQEGRSHQNPHEAQFVVGLCKYLLCQGYQPAQITILTTYTGQLFCLRKLLPAQTFQGVKVHVVDKYQGEENDVILLSLVRSNREGRVGFLQASNRICVALSRAKKGLYCIGNMAMLSKVPLWSKIQHALRKKGHVGRALPLFCQNHPETMTEVAQVADFSKVPEGGCSRPCDARLGCGHVCPRACHPYDPWHKDFQCMKPCQKVLCADGHRCTRPCFQPCGKCYVKVLKTMPGCGHQQAVPCSTPVEDFCCQEPCGKVLSCGHGCTLICGRECARHCSELVQVTLRCGHSQEVPCSTAAGVADRCLVPCRAKCLGVLECSHHCPGTCYSCSCGRFHERCRSPCSRLLICSHKCQEPCTSDCPPCRRRCQNRCVHSRCQKKCGELCTPCMEPCEWHCLHHQCHRLCSEPCDRPRCDEACPKHLPCGHPCAGMCGEPCPQKCLVCHREELTQIFFGFEDEPGARFVQLEDCGHIFEAQGLDCYMDGGEEEEEERWGSVAIKLKVCPSCQTPVRRNLRYGMLVKRSLAEVEAVKARIQGCPAEIEAGRQRLMGLLVEKAPLKKNLPDRYELLLQKLVEPSLCSGGLGLMEHLLAFYGQLAELTEATRKADPRDWAGVRKRLAEVDRWLERPRHSFTNQELSELGCEFRRLASLVEVLARCLAVRGKMEPATSGLVSQLRQLLEGPGRFTPEDEELVKAKMEALDAALPKSGLGISEVERKQIVTAVTGQSRGHWFKCPNGHIYVITECGGAMERSRCPECQEAIGGTNHRLESSNQLAPEMDGATLAAWPGTTNHPLDMANLLRLH